MPKSDIGLIGLAVMGQNLVLNMSDHGVRVAVYNRSTDKVDAFIAGSGVRPGFRRRGAQGALIRARLDRARALGCELACASTQPGTASRRNMERHGFAVAYPKLVMLVD